MGLSTPDEIKIASPSYSKFLSKFVGRRVVAGAYVPYDGVAGATVTLRQGSTGAILGVDEWGRFLVLWDGAPAAARLVYPGFDDFEIEGLVEGDVIIRVLDQFLYVIEKLDDKRFSARRPGAQGSELWEGPIDSLVENQTYRKRASAWLQESL